MDRDMAHLILLYLLKARELAISGQEHRAQLHLGLCPEAIPVLKRLSLVDMATLAQSDSIGLALRTPPQFWKDLGQEPMNGPINEALVAHLLAIGILGNEHD